MALRTRLLASAAAVTALAALATTSAQADTTVKAISGNPLTVWVGGQGQLQALRTGDTSNIFYAPSSPIGDSGFFLAFPPVTAQGAAPAQLASLSGKVYGGDGSFAKNAQSAQYTAVSQTDPTGTGTAADPFKQSTTYLVSVTTPTPADIARVEQTTTYINGAQTFDVTWKVTNLQSTALRFKALAAADFYFEGSDVGTGIFTAGPPRFIGGTNADTGRSGGFVEAASTVSPAWSHYEALPYGNSDPDAHGAVWSRVNTAADAITPSLDDSVVGTPVDNAGAVEWDEYLDPATTLAQNASVTFALTVRTSAPAALQFDQTNAGAPQGTPVTITATAKDTSDTPFTGKALRWTITGANNLSGAATIDAQGHAAITDPGTNFGPDTVVAYVDLNNNSIREPNEPQASALVTFVDNVPPACTVKVSGDRPGLGGGAGKPLVISVNCDSQATVTTRSSLSITPPSATARRSSVASAAKAKHKKKKKKKPIIVTLKPVQTVVLPGQAVPIDIAIPKATATKYAGAKVVVTVTVTAADTAGNVTTVTTKKTTTLAKKPKPKHKRKHKKH